MKETITNNILTVSYDEAVKTFCVKENTTGKVFIRDGILEGSENIIGRGDVTSSAFGNGIGLKINRVDGGSFSLELFPMLPFLFINASIKNNKNEAENIVKIVPCTFRLDIDKPANELKTLGTGGLLDPYENPGSYIFLTTVDPKNRNGVVAGWLTNERGSGVLFPEVSNNEVSIKAQIDYGRLRIESGKTEILETLMIGYFNDARLGQESLADTIATQHNIKMKPRSAVFCTWYCEKNGGSGSEQSTKEITDLVEENLKSFGLGAIQIDHTWQGGGEYNGPSRGFDRANPEGGYPNGMTRTAQYIKNAGLKAGIWWIPFSRNHQDPEYKDRLHWFAKRTDGTFYDTEWGGTSLDLTNPEVMDHIFKFAKTMKDWGYTYFKMDGMWSGTVTEHVYINDGYKDDSMGNCLPLSDTQKTQIEAYRDGLRTIRKAVGSKHFLSGCCLSQNMRTFGGSIGLVDAMRIGPDFNHDGLGVLTGVIRGSRLYFLNGRIWWNDPDPVLLRSEGACAFDEKIKGVEGDIENLRLLPSWVAVTGSAYLSSDWLPDLPKERIEIMKRCMTPNNGISRPVDAFDNPIANIWLTTDHSSGVRRDVIGIFNWDKISKNIGATTDWTGLESSKDYYAFDFWENKPLADISTSFNYDLPAMTCKVIALRANSGHPVVVSTSRHVTQGIVDIKKEEWHDGELSVISEIIGGDDYEVRIAGLNDNGKWSLKDLKILGSNKNVTIRSLPKSENGWLRILISAKKDCTVKWKASFKNK